VYNTEKQPWNKYVSLKRYTAATNMAAFTIVDIMTLLLPSM